MLFAKVHAKAMTTLRNCSSCQWGRCANNNNNTHARKLRLSGILFFRGVVVGVAKANHPSVFVFSGFLARIKVIGVSDRIIFFHTSAISKSALHAREIPSFRAIHSGWSGSGARGACCEKKTPLASQRHPAGGR